MSADARVPAKADDCITGRTGDRRCPTISEGVLMAVSVPATQVASLFPDGAGPVPGSVHEQYVAERLTEVGRFGSETLADCVRRHARDRPRAWLAGAVQVAGAEHP